ncbi:uncharacterized protein JCM6883_007492 [Sporobolomyces salmoneus]|uniref:uncharacterized protein n=1 Tax=Sporobolomyces salmoneus TaxID=183962 RepID=UPI003177A62F
MSETDYDSPPRPFSGGVERKKVQLKRVYGKKGRRKELPKETRREEESSDDEVEEVVTKRAREGKDTGGKGTNGKGKQKAKAAEEDGEVDSSSQEEEVDSRGPKPKGRLPRAAKLAVSQKQSRSRSRASSVASDNSDTKLDDESSNRTQPDAFTSKRTRSKSVISRSDSHAPPSKSRQSLSATQTDGHTQPQPEKPTETRTRRGKASPGSSLTKLDKAFPPLIHSSVSRDIQVLRASIDSPRSSALVDKSNRRTSTTTTQDSPRLTDLPPTLPWFTRLYSTRLSMSSQGGGGGGSRDPSLLESPKKSPAASKISVFKDASNPEAKSSTSSIAPRPRTSISTTTQPVASTSKPLPPRRRLSSITALTSHNPFSHSRPSTSHSHTNSNIFNLPRSPAPIVPPPEFQFTTTLFENSLSFSRSLFNLPDGEGTDGFIGAGFMEGHKEGEGWGMDSGFVLESWDQERFEREDALEAQEEERRRAAEEEEKRVTLESKEVEVELCGKEGGKILVEEGEEENEKTFEMEKGIEAQFGDESNSTIKASEVAMSRGGNILHEEKEEEENEMVSAKTFEEAESEVESGNESDTEAEESESDSAGEVVGAEAEVAGQQMEEVLEFDPPELEEASPSNEMNDEEQDLIPDDDSTSSNPSSPLPLYDALHLPPRRPRSPRFLPSPSNLALPLDSSEDDLAYLIRTTATHSSEDDLPPPPSDCSSDEREFELAEREVGRGVKTTSRQREKRVEESRKRGRGYLRIGEGKGGRRLRWKREIIDLEETREEASEEEDD